MGSSLGSESTRRSFLQEAVIIAAAMLAYFGIRNLTVGSTHAAFANADRIVELERSLHVDFERSIQGVIVGSDFLTMLVNWVYIWGHWPVILSVAHRALLLSPRPLLPAPQCALRLGRDRLRPLRLLPGGAAEAPRHRTRRHGDGAVERVPRAPATRPDEPVRGVPEPARRVERPRRPRPAGHDGAPRSFACSRSSCRSPWPSPSWRLRTTS